jgi:3-oxoadipate enol-lactonase
MALTRLKKENQSMTSFAEEDLLANRTIPDDWMNATSRKIIPTDFGEIVVRIGGNEQGPVMIFWPSLLLDASMWSHQFEHYAPNYRIILINPPGFGGSAPLRHPITVAESASCLRQILDALQIEACCVVGNSWGSLTAAAFAADHPKRVLAAIITNGTAAPPTREVAEQMSGLVASLEQCDIAPDWLLPVAQQAFAGSTAENQKPEFLVYLGRVL